MSYLIEQHLDRHPEDIDAFHTRFQAYYSYLESIREKTPPKAFSFAMADWHYDYTNPQSPHDSWVESLSIKELSSGTRSEIRSVAINLNLLGAYHDGYIELIYPHVIEYALHCYSTHHDDWDIDEIALLENGYILHDILFRSGARWKIVAQDIFYKWNPIENSSPLMSRRC